MNDKAKDWEQTYYLANKRITQKTETYYPENSVLPENRNVLPRKQCITQKTETYYLENRNVLPRKQKCIT